MLILDIHSRGRLCHTKSRVSALPQPCAKLRWRRKEEGLFIVFVVIFVVQTAAGKKVAQGAFAGGAALLSSHIAIAVNYDVDRVNLGLKHGGQIGVVGKNDAGRPRMLLQILLHCFFGFTDVNLQNDESFVGISVVNPVHESGLLETVAAPGGPEFQQHDFAFYGVVVEPLTARGGGIESRGRFFGLGFARSMSGNRAEQAGDHEADQRRAQDISRSHGAKLYHTSPGLGLVSFRSDNGRYGFGYDPRRMPSITRLAMYQPASDDWAANEGRNCRRLALRRRGY